VQTKQKYTKKSNVTKRTNFYQKRMPLSRLFTSGNINKTCTYQMCKRQLADTNVLIGRYQLSAKRPLIGQYQLWSDYWCISDCEWMFSSYQLDILSTSNDHLFLPRMSTF